MSQVHNVTDVPVHSPCSECHNHKVKTRTPTHKRTFRARFRYQAFGWKGSRLPSLKLECPEYYGNKPPASAPSLNLTIPRPREPWQSGFRRAATERPRSQNGVESRRRSAKGNVY